MQYTYSISATQNNSWSVPANQISANLQPAKANNVDENDEEYLDRDFIDHRKHSSVNDFIGGAIFLISVFAIFATALNL